MRKMDLTNTKQEPWSPLADSIIFFLLHILTYQVLLLLKDIAQICQQLA